MCCYPMKNRAQIVSCEPWPAKGIEHYQSVADGKWGYLRLFDDGHFEFDDSQSPPPDEILARWSSYLEAEFAEP